MPLFHITIEKVIVQDDKLLKEINRKLDALIEDPTGEKKQAILDNLNQAIEKVKKIV